MAPTSAILSVSCVRLLSNSSTEDVIALAAVVHADHHENDIRIELGNAPVEACQRAARIVAADSRRDHNVHCAA